MSISYEVYKEGGLLNGCYQKLEDISEGSYGIVSLAKDTRRSKLVAVKYIFKESSESKHGTASKRARTYTSKSLTSITRKMDDDICQEAIHEINIQEKLGSHKNIVSLVDCFDSFIILEYCSRGDLYEAIKANIGPSGTRDVVNVTIQLISAVEFAHKKGIYHRDIKPENILITDDWTIKLSDWGLASDEKLCKDFGVGSERYMAPELFDEGNIEVYDASKCDIWSIGICLLNIVFHKNPFACANESDKSFSYFACNREALFDIFSTMSEDLFSVLRHSLTLDPDNRSLEQLKRELLHVQSLTIDDDLNTLYAKESSESSEVQPISINQESYGEKKHHYKVKKLNRGNLHKNDVSNRHFAVPTPNTHITNHLHDFKRDDFNRKDFFTPPSVSAHYMEKFAADRNRKGVYHPPHQRSSGLRANNLLPPNNHNAGSGSVPILGSAVTLTHTTNNQNKKSRAKSFNSLSSSVGKYVPPNLRSPNVMKSPLHTSIEPDTFLDSTSDDDDDDGGLFVLEEADSSPIYQADSVDYLSKRIPDLTLDDDSEGLSSAPSLIAPTPVYKTPGIPMNALNFLDKKPATSGTTNVTAMSKTILSDDHGSRTSSNVASNSTSASVSGPGSRSGNSSSKRVYVPPHHRENYHSHVLGASKKSGNGHARRYSSHMSKKPEMISASSSVPTKSKSDWFPQQKMEDLHNGDLSSEEQAIDDEGEEEDDDDEFEKSEFYKSFVSRVGERPRGSVGESLRNGKNRAIRETTRELPNSIVIEE